MTLDRHIGNLRRKAGAGLIALVLVTSHGWVLMALGTSSTECGQKCCRVRKSCCCRQKRASGESAPVVYARTCPPGCSQSIGVPAALQAWFERPFRVFFAAPVMTLLTVTHVASLSCFVIAYALFQRPPPQSHPRFA